MASFFFAILYPSKNIRHRPSKKPKGEGNHMQQRAVLLKLSGESLMGEQGYGIDPDKLNYYTEEIIDGLSTGVQIGIVIGGGNIYRGLQGAASGMNRVQGDYMGMLATIINSMALQSALEDRGIKVVLMSGLELSGLTQKANSRNAKKALKEGHIVLFAGGTGNPYFTTDTAAALRAAETGAEMLLKGTRVDGVYTADPERDKNAKKLKAISYDDAIKNDYRIMDMTAFTLCRENHIPIVVFNINHSGNLKRILEGEHLGTKVG